MLGWLAGDAARRDTTRRRGAAGVRDSRSAKHRDATAASRLPRCGHERTIQLPLARAGDLQDSVRFKIYTRLSALHGRCASHRLDLYYYYDWRNILPHLSFHLAHLCSFI